MTVEESERYEKLLQEREAVLSRIDDMQASIEENKTISKAANDEIELLRVPPPVFANLPKQQTPDDAIADLENQIKKKQNENAELQQEIKQPEQFHQQFLISP